MNYEKFLFIAAFTINFYILFLGYIHIYQLNHYMKEVQLNWNKKTINKILFNSVIYLISFVFILTFEKGYLYGTLLYLLMLLYIWPKKAKKALVYTNRIKRMITISFIVNTLFTIISYLLFSEFLILPLLSITNPYLIFIIDIINEPINKIINKKYINEAKNILKDMPNLMIIGITGSFGKTSMKTFVGELLSIKYNTLITPKNYNTTLGVVITVREYLKSTHEIFVCEMGANKVGDIKEICDLVHPDHAIITSIGPQHLETFHSIDNVIKTKFELVDSIKDGKIFLNYDNDYIKDRKVDKKNITYGIENNKTDYNAYDIKTSSKGLTFKMKDEKGKELLFTTKLIGKHNVLNLVGAIAVAINFGIPMKSLVNKVRNLEPVKHRLEFLPGFPKAYIDDAYNSNPEGAKGALDALSEFEGTRIIITPGMVELGEKEYELNYEFGKYMFKKCDYIILVGKDQTVPIQDGIKETKFDKNKLFIANTIEEALKIADKIEPGKQKTILLENDLPDQY